MSAKLLQFQPLGGLNRTERRILRYAVGATVAMAIALGFDWQLSYLTPVLALVFLASPAPPPTFKTGAAFVLIIAIAGWLALVVGKLFIAYPLVFIPFAGLVLFHIFFAVGGPIPQVTIIWMLLEMLIIPLMVMQSPALGEAIVKYLITGGAATILSVWIAHAMVPDVDVEGAPAAPPPTPKTAPVELRYRIAVESTIVVLPVLVLFYFFQAIESLLILIYIGLLSMQPGFAKNFKGGLALILGNVLGGAVAIFFYELLVIVPEFLFMLFLILLAGLLFGMRLFSGSPKAGLFGTAFSTLLLVIGSETSSFAGEAETKVYTRIIQLTMAMTYVVVAFGLLEHFKQSRQRKN